MSNPTETPKQGKHLKEIFAGHEDLLENPVIKDMLGEVRSQYERMYALMRHKDEFEGKVLEIYVYCELNLIGGTSCKDAMKAIGKLLNDW